MHHDSILLGDLLDSGLPVSRCGAEIEMGWLGSIVALEGDMAVSTADIEGLFIIKMIFLFPDFHCPGATYINDSKFPALSEIISPKDLRGGEEKLLLNGNGSTGDDAVEHRIDHVDLVRSHDLLHKIFLTDPGRVVMFGVEIARGLANLTIQFHIQLFWLFSNIR